MGKEFSKERVLTENIQGLGHAISWNGDKLPTLVWGKNVMRCNAVKKGPKLIHNIWNAMHHKLKF